MPDQTRPTPPKAGLITFHFSDNFGALLQAYGLRTWLLRQGVAAEFVDYHPAHVEAGGRLRLPISAAALKADLKILFLAAMRLKQQVFGNRAQKHRFDVFRSEALGISGPEVHTAAEVDAFLTRPEGRFDLLLCGSDQIWAPSEQFGFDPVYFLHFPGGAQGARRCSYAPSFGRATLDAAHEAEAGPWLAALDGLSAREQSGVAMAQRLSGKPVAWVPDPTILLGDFAELAQEGSGEFGADHVFCYALRTGTGIRDVAEHAAAQLGVPILSPDNSHRRWREIGQTVYPSPPGWVAGLAQSRFVVTNSFHGTVFSILFRRGRNPHAGSSSGAAPFTLLGRLGMIFCRSVDRMIRSARWTSNHEASLM